MLSPLGITRAPVNSFHTHPHLNHTPNVDGFHPRLPMIPIAAAPFPTINTPYYHFRLSIYI